jgi:hypothetical protein
MTPHPDTERLRYEIENKALYINEGIAFWNNGKIAFDHYSEWIIIHNSNGKEIASFNLKAWK